MIAGPGKVNAEAALDVNHLHDRRSVIGWVKVPLLAGAAFAEGFLNKQGIILVTAMQHVDHETGTLRSDHYSGKGPGNSDIAGERRPGVSAPILQGGYADNIFSLS